MLFASIIFLFVFLPTTVILHHIVNNKTKNYILLVFSLVFYAWGGLDYLVLLITSILTNHLVANLINNSRVEVKKRWLTIGIVVNVLIIGVFKYTDFFIENVNALSSWTGSFEKIPLAHIVLPLGISFFTFQQMSMLWDIYNSPSKRKITLLETALYVGFFPQLIAGPIVRYTNFVDQVRFRTYNLDQTISGINRFILGLFKKMILANTFAIIVDQIYDLNSSNLSTSIAWLGAVSYMFQIYFDFSGYSDMAIGLGRVFGFNFLENFNLPYISKSIREFWRRWHISLSSWFRDYVYIPLGGSKKGVFRTYTNLIVVFFLTGFWHGATWSFVIWGLFHGFFIVIERMFLSKFLDKIPVLLRVIYTLFIVIIGWVLFRADTLSHAVLYIGRMFGTGSNQGASFLTYLNLENILVFMVAIALSSGIVKKMSELKFFLHLKQHSVVYFYVKSSLVLFAFLYSVLSINSGSYNPFIYFRF